MAHANRKRLRAALTIVVVALAATPLASAREKIDVITLINGDRITGEIKQLNMGKLEVKTDAMDTVELEWPYVKRVDSTQLFEVEHADGTKYYGIITPADEQGRFVVIGPEGMVAALDHDRIVRIGALEETWWDRWKGFVDLGFTYLSANNEIQFSLDAQATYRAKKFNLRNTLTSTMSDREVSDPEQSAKNSWSTWTTRYEHFLKKRYFWTGFVGGEHNQEQQLDLRLTAGGGVGRYLIQTNRTVLSMNVGLAGNRERYIGEDEFGQWTAEGILTTSYDYFFFGTRKTSVSASLNLLPSLTTSGRYRINFNSSLRRKFAWDLTVALSLTTTYDSKPPTGGDAQKSDNRVITSVGWTF